MGDVLGMGQRMKTPKSVKRQEKMLEIQERQQAQELAAKQRASFAGGGRSKTLFDGVLGIDKTISDKIELGA